MYCLADANQGVAAFEDMTVLGSLSAPVGKTEKLRAALRALGSMDDEAIFSFLIYKRLAKLDGRCIVVRWSPTQVA